MVAPPWQRFGKTQYQSGNRAASHSIRPQQPRQRMFHPLIRMLATRPELLAQHLSGYAQLLGAQLGVAGGLLQDRALLLAGLLGGVLLGLGLAGVAGLLAAALPLAAMPAPWLLIAIPALPLGLATAIYMAEIASEPVRRILKPMVELLAGIPSVVYGFFGLVIIVPGIQRLFDLPVGETALAGRGPT